MTVPKNLFVFGDSHVGAIKKGLENLLESGGVPHDWAIRVLPLVRGGLLPTQFFRTEEGAIRFDARFLERIPLDNEPVIYGFSGNAHTTRVVRDIDWSTHAPAAVASKEAPISAAMLHEIFWHDQRYMLQLLEAMKKLGMQVFVIEAPHLFRHNAVFGRARRQVLLHVDREYRSFFKAELDKRDVPLVAVPQACLDEEGFTLDIYRSPKPRDNHHANALFGEVMLGEILAYLDPTVRSDARVTA